MSAPPPMDAFYRGVRAVARFWLWFFFKSIDVRHPERVPDGGPILLCVNHPNNFIDSLLVGATARRKVHYLATAALFRHRPLARFLLACGAIPVYRKQDDPDKMDRNLDTFAACFATFARGRVVAIYPEGTTHAEVRVQRACRAVVLRVRPGHRDVRSRLVIEVARVGHEEIVGIVAAAQEYEQEARRVGWGSEHLAPEGQRRHGGGEGEKELATIHGGPQR